MSTVVVPTPAVTLWCHTLKSPPVISQVRLVEGDWDIQATPLMEGAIAQSIKGLLGDGIPMTDHGYHRRLRKRGFDADAIYKEAERRILSLQASVLQNGVLAQETDNIRVAIGRTGQIIAVDGGTHRLILAHLLGVSHIPVEVVARHPDWEAYRQHIRTVEKVHYQQFPHPDLQDFQWYFNDQRADLILPHLKGDSLIDLGCRYGTECHRMEDEGWACTGIEQQESVVKVATVLRDALHRKFTLWQGDATTIPPMKADVLLAYNVLIYLRNSPNYKQMLRNLQVNQIIFSARETDKGAKGSLDAARQVAAITGKSHIVCLGDDGNARHPARRTSVGSVPRKIYLIE